MSSTHQHSEMPQSPTPNILATTRELLLPMTLTELLNSFPLILIIFVSFADPERLRSIFPPPFYLILGMSASTILYLVLGMGVMFTISLSLVDTALSVRLSTPELCLWLVLSESLIAILDRFAGKPIVNLNGGRPRSRSEWFHQLADKPRMELRRFYSETMKMAAGTFQWIYAALYYSLLGLTGAALLYFVPGMSSAVTVISRGLRDTALSWTPSIPVFCLCLLLDACLRAFFVRYADRQIFKIRSMTERLTQLAHKPLTNLHNLFHETKKAAARIWHRLKPESNQNPHPVPVTPEDGRADHLREMAVVADALQEWADDLRETEDDLRAWDKELRERDEHLRELEITLREWEDGLREALEGFQRSGEWGMRM